MLTVELRFKESGRTRLREDPEGVSELPAAVGLGLAPAACGTQT